MSPSLSSSALSFSSLLSPDQLAQIHAEAFDSAWDEAAFAALLGTPGVFALGDDAGFILIRVVLDEAEILTVAVRPALRRQGIGARLVAQAIVESAARGAERMFLEVAQSNNAAQLLYKSAGFEQVGRRKAYYTLSDGTKEDALMMVLNFPQ